MSERDQPEPGAYYVKNLLDKAAFIPVDEDPNYKVELPPFYDEEKFNRARDFYVKNRMAALLSMLTGLIAVLAVPTVLDVLIETRMSSTPYTAFRRYIQTIFHVINWFRYDMKPGTPSWKSIEAVRKLHFNANKRCQKAGVGMISQKDMALTQFGFMGFTVCKPELIGVLYTTEDMDAYCHFWRVVGYMLGIKDEFNMCTDSFETTRQIADQIRTQIYKKHIGEPSKSFKQMTEAMIEGLWGYAPNTDHDAFMYFTAMLADVPGYTYSLFDFSEKPKPLEKLSLYSRFSLWMIIFVNTYMVRIPIFRLYSNTRILVLECFAKYFPYLSMYQFKSVKKAYVYI